MRLLQWFIGFVALAALAMLLYPLAVLYLDDGKGRAYRQILDFHTYAHAPRKRQGGWPFLYVSEFPRGDPRQADENMAYADGTVRGRRVLWNDAIQGGEGQAQNPAAFGALRALPLLPSGLAGPGEVAVRDLLIVSQGVNGHWVTFYYDRRRLSTQVRRMQALLAAANQN